MEPGVAAPSPPSSSPMPGWDCPELPGEMGSGAAVTSHPARLGNSQQCPVLAGAAEQPPAPCRAQPAPNPCRIALSCPQIHHGRDTHHGKEGDRFLGKPPPPARPRAKGTSRMTPAAQGRGCGWPPVPACPQPAQSTMRHKLSHIPVLSAPGTCAPRTAPSDLQSHTKKLL